MERLLRACTDHHSELPWCKWRQLRMGSPPPEPSGPCGVSTLMTSAPNSPKMRAANGPAMSVPSSRTFSPVKADMMSSPRSATRFPSGASPRTGEASSAQGQSLPEALRASPQGHRCGLAKPAPRKASPSPKRYALPLRGVAADWRSQLRATSLGHVSSMRQAIDSWHCSSPFLMREHRRRRARPRCSCAPSVPRRWCRRPRIQARCPPARAR